MFCTMPMAARTVEIIPDPKRPTSWWPSAPYHRHRRGNRNLFYYDGGFISYLRGFCIAIVDLVSIYGTCRFTTLLFNLCQSSTCNYSLVSDGDWRRFGLRKIAAKLDQLASLREDMNLRHAVVLGRISIRSYYVARSSVSKLHQREGHKNVYVDLHIY